MKLNLFFIFLILSLSINDAREVISRPPSGYQNSLPDTSPPLFFVSFFNFK